MIFTLTAEGAATIQQDAKLGFNLICLYLPQNNKAFII